MNTGLLSVDDALRLLLSKARAVVDIEEVPTLEATSRVLARAQRSTMDVPPMDNSAMDGYAVRTSDGGRLRVAQKIMAGSTGKPLQPGTAARIFTGAQIPPGADAVVMQEHCEVRGDEVLIKKAPKAGDWIRLAGSDVRKGGEILPAGKRLLPQDTGLAASVGIKTLPVFRRIRLGLFFTGDELVMPGEPLAPGRIYNSNRFTLRGLAEVFGCEVRDYGIVPDSLEATRQVLRRAAGRAVLGWRDPDAGREFRGEKWKARGGLDFYPTRDSAVLPSTAWAEGLVDTPPHQAIRKGDMVRFLPYSELYR